MAENPYSFSRTLRPILVACLICTCIVVIIVRCDEGTYDPDCHVVLERGDVGVWMATSNEIVTPGAAGGYDRQGFMVQLGDFQTSIHEYDGFSIHHSGGTEPVERSGDLIYWIDINASGSEAMDETDALAMFPLGVSDRCQELYNDPDYADYVDCIRTRMIHPYMLTGHTLITFWQGDNGWRAYANPDRDYSNEFCFELPDSFEVTLWTADRTDATVTFKDPVSWSAGEVSLIEVHSKTRGPDRGETQAPPWIYP